MTAWASDKQPRNKMNSFTGRTNFKQIKNFDETNRSNFEFYHKTQKNVSQTPCTWFSEKKIYNSHNKNWS